jgi:adenylate cyclase
VSSERRLAAIMFTDMVGYSALSQTNESLALRALESHRSLIRPLLAKHNGREVKTIGDAFLVEFESALDATECAVQIQEVLHEQDEDSPEKASIRIGIHVGDVVHRQGDVYGDAVNIASRIYPLAKGGEICVSEQVYDQVRNKIPFRFQKLEPRELKNIFVQIDVYKLELAWEKTMGDRPKEPLPPDRIAVLPFVNISPDPNDEFFADGLTEELIANLSLVKGLKVIARTSVMNYKKKEMNVSSIGSELEVGTVVEGSVRKVANRIRVTVQVIDVNTEEHLWASNYDANLDDVFAVQSDIARKVADSLPGTLTRAKAPATVGKDTDDVTAYMNFLQGRELMYARMEGPLRQSIRFFEQAIERDPKFARAYVGEAESYASLGMSGYVPWQDAIETGKMLLKKALAIDEELADAHSLLSEFALMADEPFHVMEAEARKAIEINPNLAEAHVNLALAVSLTGKVDSWVQELKTAYQLDPLSPRVLERLSAAYLYAGLDTEALELLEKTLHLYPLNTHRWLWVYYISKGRLDDAQGEVAELEKLEPAWEYTLQSKGYLAGLRGDRQTAESAVLALEATHKRGWARSSLAGYIFYALGDVDTFFAYMRAAAEDHTLRASDLMYSPLFASARADPRMKEILNMTGIVWPQAK